MRGSMDDWSIINWFTIKHYPNWLEVIELSIDMVDNHQCVVKNHQFIHQNWLEVIVVNNHGNGEITVDSVRCLDMFAWWLIYWWEIAEVKDIMLIDVTPLTLGVETDGGVFSQVLPRGSAVPWQALAARGVAVGIPHGDLAVYSSQLILLEALGIGKSVSSCATLEGPC